MPITRNFTFYAAMALAYVISLHNNAFADDAIHFNQDIRPLLSAACFRCHGSDTHSREAELRLDTLDGATSPAASGERPIVPGDIEASEVWKRITSNDPDTVMPLLIQTDSYLRKKRP